MIADRSTKTAHFLPVKTTHSMDQLATLYIQEIVRLHGVPVSITSDRDTRFTSRFWKSFQKALGTWLSFSTTYHPQTDGQSECTIQTLEDMLCACSLDLQGNWEDHLPLAEFAYNNSFQASIGMAPYEVLYGRQCRSPTCWIEVGKGQLSGTDIVFKSTEIVDVIWGRLKAAQDRQKSYADAKRREIEFQVGTWVFLKISPTKGVIRFGKKGKLNPRYVGPFEVIERIGPVAYRLTLTSELGDVHDVFHVPMLKPYISDPSHVLVRPPIGLQRDLTYVERPLRIIDRQEKRLRSKCVARLFL